MENVVENTPTITTNPQPAIAGLTDRDYHQRNLIRDLPCSLSDHEIVERSRQREKLERDLEAIDEVEKAQKTEWKNQREGIQGQINELRETIETGKEKRPVICDSFFEASQIKTMRRDTGEVFHSRPANAREAQASIPGIGGALMDEAAKRMDDSADDDERGDDDLDIEETDDDADDDVLSEKAKKSRRSKKAKA